jgi:phosphonate transport system permease protein
VSISVVGTAIGIALGGALALPATATLLLDRRDAPGRLGRAARLIAYSSSRLLLAMLRSIPELVWVLLCILAVGLGPFAGALALGLHTAGVLGKLYAETLEEVPEGPVEELRAAGATRPQRLLWAMWPQARETLLGYTLLRWETNLRVSTVVGMVGGGGLGLALYNNVQLGFYPRAATLVLLIYLLVSVTDWLSDRLRKPVTSVEAPPASAMELVSAASGSPAAP